MSTEAVSLGPENCSPGLVSHSGYKSKYLELGIVRHIQPTGISLTFHDADLRATA